MQIIKCSLMLVLLLVAIWPAFAVANETGYDTVIVQGRVIDPETGLNAVRNIGIQAGRIAAITSNPISGDSVIQASGLIVAPGFIDLHVHGMTNVEQEYQVRDGVTTALEMESGMVALGLWLQSREGSALINYGAAASWPVARIMAMPEYDLKRKISHAKHYEDIAAIIMQIDGSTHESVDRQHMAALFNYLDSEMRAGGLGYAVPIGYFPGAQPEEDYRLYEYAAKQGVPIFTHVREGGLIAVQQVMSNAMLTGAPLHIVHMNSMALEDAELGIEMVNTAQANGYDITTEIYPYTAASTDLASALFEDGWKDAFGIDYADLQWVATGERLTANTFKQYRQTGGIVIIHMMKPDWISAAIKTKGTIIASDGMPYAKLAHPRTAGTFARVLGKYVREEGQLSLLQAITKMTLLPAKRMETIAPSMRFKGRLQVGADADITVFNPDTVIDKATFEEGLAFSHGIEYVMVNGVLVVHKGETVANVFPGEAIVGKYKQ